MESDMMLLSALAALLVPSLLASGPESAGIRVYELTATGTSEASLAWTGAAGSWQAEIKPATKYVVVVAGTQTRDRYTVSVTCPDTETADYAAKLDWPGHGTIYYTFTSPKGTPVLFADFGLVKIQADLDGDGAVTSADAGLASDALAYIGTIDTAPCPIAEAVLAVPKFSQEVLALATDDCCDVVSEAVDINQDGQFDWLDVVAILDQASP